MQVCVNTILYHRCLPGYFVMNTDFLTMVAIHNNYYSWLNLQAEGQLNTLLADLSSYLTNRGCLQPWKSHWSDLHVSFCFCIQREKNQSNECFNTCPQSWQKSFHGVLVLQNVYSTLLFLSNTHVFPFCHCNIYTLTSLPPSSLSSAAAWCFFINSFSLFGFCNH